MTKKGKILFIYFALLISISGCKAKKEADLSGVYVAKYPFGTEKLILYSNGKYLQEVNVVINSNSKTASTTGNWSYDPTTKHITFENALVVADGFGELNKGFGNVSSGFVILTVCRRFPGSPIKIGINDDCGYYYIKENDSNSVE